MTVKKDGWWIRIHTDKTECSSITFQIGTEKNNRQEWTTWRSGEATEFDVPIGYRNVWSLYLQATANPNDKNAYFGLMYKGAGVKHFDFDDVEDHQENQNNRDGESYSSSVFV
jgi:hypothetical protein